MKRIVSGLLLVILAIILLPLAAPFDPQWQDRAAADAAPDARHWLGTDEYGRDVWSRFLFGARWSLGVGAGAAAIVLGVGWTIGGLAGFAGGRVDGALMGLAEIFLAVPWLYLLLAVRAALPLTLPARLTYLTMVLLIAIVSWARPARLVRGLVLSLTGRGYVAAARGLGVPEWRIFTRHILPDTAGLLLTQALLLVPRFVLAEVTLTYLGLGGGGPEASWGGLLLPLKQFYLLEQQWWKVLPTVLMIPFFIGLAVAGTEVEKRLSHT